MLCDKHIHIVGMNKLRNQKGDDVRKEREKIKEKKEKKPEK